MEYRIDKAIADQIIEIIMNSKGTPYSANQAIIIKNAFRPIPEPKKEEIKKEVKEANR